MFIWDDISFGGAKTCLTPGFLMRMGGGQDRRRADHPSLIRIRLKITPQERVDTHLEDGEDEEEEKEEVDEVEEEDTDQTKDETGRTDLQILL